MDFIERWLHVAPDGGNGTVELAYLATALASVLAFACRRSLRRLFAIGVGSADRR